MRPPKQGNRKGCPYNGTPETGRFRIRSVDPQWSAGEELGTELRRYIPVIGISPVECYMRVEINDTMHGSPENVEGESLRPISRRGFLNYVLGG